MSNPHIGSLLNRRSFVTGLSSVCSLVLLRGGFASIEHKSGLAQRARAPMDLGVSAGLTVGAVMMVVQRDKVRALEAAGYSDLDTKRRMRTDAIFDIRSISKPITVFGALLLLDDGKLGLEDPLAKFLPEFLPVQVKGQTKATGVPITIRHLMTHTSGLAAERPPELESRLLAGSHDFVPQVD
jgi:CubicO group peptidase (beta-lactamase class C family)